MQLDMQLIAGRLGNMEWIHKDAPRGCTHVEASGILFLSHQEPSAEAEHIPPVKETEFLVPRNQELLSHCMASVIRYKKVGSPASVILKFSLELKCGANGGGNQKEVARENNQRTQSIFLSPGNPLKAVTVSQKIKPNSKVVYFLAARTLWSPIHEDCKGMRTVDVIFTGLSVFRSRRKTKEVWAENTRKLLNNTEIFTGIQSKKEIESDTKSVLSINNEKPHHFLWSFPRLSNLSDILQKCPTC
ncbi:uncharacterized protein [Manis javanica]|uniref:uncharacterized protein isoform X1 n=1 Tax=Manis javanica TaxID=9974 RepID=UPI003C6D7D47